MASERRTFLKQLSVILPGISILKDGWTGSKKTKKPIVVSTWDSGMEVNKVAYAILESGGKAIDAVEKGANSIENTINCCVGLGGNPDRDGFVTLDACIMDDNYNCGSVAFLQKIHNPISVARKVMELTPHVMLVGDGALQFALEHGFKLESGALSPTAAEEYKKWLEKSEYKPIINIEQNQSKKHTHPLPPKKLEDGSFNHDTMGLVALDMSGNLSGACTTSSQGFKMHGRVGDSPIIGAGLYIDNEVGGATSSGQGEETIRIVGSHLVVEYMRQGFSPQKACRKTIDRLVNINPQKAREFQVGFLALNKYGEHGAYAVQPGFSYAVTDENGHAKVIQSPSYF